MSINVLIIPIPPLIFHEQATYANAKITACV